jgi:hypothetical protein
VLAHVEYAYTGGGPRGALPLGLGELYASDTARHYWECRALVSVGLTPNELSHLPIDEWPVTEFNVFATAYAIKELLSGRLLPPTAIVDGGIARPEDRGIMEKVVETELAQPMWKPPDMDLPAYCLPFIGTVAAPILSRDFPRGFKPPMALQNEDFREYAFRVLGQLPSDTAVTIDLKLDFPANVEVLASLVREYDIKGLRADLVPTRSNTRLLGEAELSTYGGNLDSLVERVGCHLRLGELMYETSGEWYADWINVSLSTENAALFLSYPNIAQATIGGAHPLSELDRLADYYARLATRVNEMPKSIVIPSGCEHVYVHNDQEEVGSIRNAPPE